MQSDGTYSVSDYTGSAAEVIIPSVYNGCAVTSIGNQAFYDSSGLTSITIPNSVTSIDVLAFAYCSGLTSIHFEGTKAQWDNVIKGDDWKQNTPTTTVYFKNGTCITI